MTITYDVVAKYERSPMRRPCHVHLTRQPMYMTQMDYLPIYGQLGMLQQAREAWSNVLKTEPNCSENSFLNWYQRWNMRPQDVVKFMQGVRKSGVVAR